MSLTPSFPLPSQLVAAYYNVLPLLCAIGNFEKMYLPPVMDPSQDVYTNQKLYETWMSEHLRIGPSDRVLDIGCGRGRVAHFVASRTGAHVTGINIASEQVKAARSYADRTGLSSQLAFVAANYNDPLPFQDEAFDALYYVQVIGYGTNLTSFFAEVNRVLKPGGRAVFEDYILLPDYNETDALHQRLRRASMTVLGGVIFYPDHYFTSALLQAGFDIVWHNTTGPSIAPQSVLLRGERYFWKPLAGLLSVLGHIGIIPKHFSRMIDRIREGGVENIQAHEMVSTRTASEKLSNCVYCTYRFTHKHFLLL